MSALSALAIASRRLGSCRRVVGVAAAVGAAGVGVLTGCGSEGARALDQQELSAKANAICARYVKQIEALKVPDHVSDPTKAAATLTAAHALAVKQHGELAALHVDDAVERPWARFLVADQRGTALVGELADAASVADAVEGRRLVGRFDGVSARIDATARAVGADSCGNSHP